MRQTVSIALACVLVATLAPAARAQAVPPPQPPVMVEESALPNRALFRGGITMFAVGYVPALGVALFSDHKGDSNLFIPVAGPWIDLGTRACSGSVTLTMEGPIEVSSGQRCGTSGTDRAALILDGVVQGVGAVAFISSLVIPERRMAPWAGSSPTRPFTVVPSSLGGRGMGAVVAGRF